MTLRQMEYLIAVVTAGSFAGAATQLAVSQPTLSQQVRALEDVVGCPLLARTSRGVTLTAAGRAFLPDAQAAVSSARRAVESGRRASRSVPQTLRIASVRSLAVSVLPTLIKRWVDTYPSVSIHVQECGHRERVAELTRSGKVDLGIGPLPREWTGAHVQMGWEQLVLVLPSDDPLLQAGRRVGLDAFAHREWVLYDENNGFLEPLLAACRSVGFEPRAAVRTEQIEAAARLAAAGIGPALVPARNVPADLVRNAKGTDPPIAWKVYAYATRARFGGSTARFVAILSDAPWQHELLIDPRESDFGDVPAGSL